MTERGAALGALAAFLTLTVAGCVAPPPSSEAPALQARPTAVDSAALLAVESASTGLAYGDVLLLVDALPFRHGAAADLARRAYGVEGKWQASDLVQRGDVLRVPAAGMVSLELVHAPTGQSLQKLELTIADLTAPEAPRPTAPVRGAVDVPRQAVFSWLPVADPGGVTYTLEFWAASAPVDAPPARSTGLAEATWAAPASDPLLPATTYRWHVRATDAAGNLGPWSPEWEFTTALSG